MLASPAFPFLIIIAALIIGGLIYLVSAWPKKVFYEKLHAIDELYSQAINNPHNYIYRPWFFAKAPLNSTTTANLSSITKDIEKINDLLTLASKTEDVYELYKDTGKINEQLEKFADPLPAQYMDFETTKTIELNSCFRDLQNLCLSEDINKELKDSNLTVDDYYQKYVKLYTHIADSTQYEVAILPDPHELSPQETIAKLQHVFKIKPIEQGTDVIKYYEYKVLGAYTQEEWEDYQLTKDSPEMRKHYKRMAEVDELHHQILTDYDNYIHNPEFFSSKSEYNLTTFKKQIDDIISNTDGYVGNFGHHFLSFYFDKLNNAVQTHLKPAQYTSTEIQRLEKNAEDIIDLCSSSDFDHKVNSVETRNLHAKYCALYAFMSDRYIGPIDLLPDPNDNAPQETLEKLHVLLTHRPVAEKSRFYAYCKKNEKGIINRQGFEPKAKFSEKTGNVQIIHGNNNVQVMGNSVNTTNNTQTTVDSTEGEKPNQAELFDKIAQLQQSYYHVMTDPEIMITAPIIRDTSYDKVAVMEENYAELTAIIPEDKNAELTTKQYKKLNQRYTAAQTSFDAALEYAYTIGLNGISHHDRIRARVLLDKALDPSNEHEAHSAYEHLVDLLAQVYAEDTETNYRHYFNPKSMPELDAYIADMKALESSTRD